MSNGTELRAPVVPVEGQAFKSKQDWINRASRVLTRHPEFHDTQHGDAGGYRGRHFTALCFDQRGRRCWCGKDFDQAEKDNAYPIWWVWPDQIAEMLFIKWEAADEIKRLREIITSAFDELEGGDESGCYLTLKTAVNALGGQSDAG